MTQEDIDAAALRQHQVNQVLATTELSGLKPSPELLEDFTRFAKGDITTDEIVQRTVGRYKR